MIEVKGRNVKIMKNIEVMIVRGVWCKGIISVLKILLKHLKQRYYYNSNEKRSKSGMLYPGCDDTSKEGSLGLMNEIKTQYRKIHTNATHNSQER